MRGSFNQYLTGFLDHATSTVGVDRMISPAWREFGPPPAGNGKLEAFGIAAILHQPLDYVTHVADDFHHFWADHHRAFIRADVHPDPNVEAAVAGDYAGPAGITSGGTGFVGWYGETIEITGVLMIALLLAPLTGLFASNVAARQTAILFACTGWLLPLIAVAVASVDPRFLLPSYGPLAAAAAIGVGDGVLRRAVTRIGARLGLRSSVQSRG